MQIVIEITDRMYEAIKQDHVPIDIGRFIRNGTPLPKGHGRLIDADELVKNIVKEYGVNNIHELPQDIKMFYDKFINSAPTILDATFDYKLKNYAFFRE